LVHGACEECSRAMNRVEESFERSQRHLDSTRRGRV
jgi:hypothetical protein